MSNIFSGLQSWSTAGSLDFINESGTNPSSIVQKILLVVKSGTSSVSFFLWSWEQASVYLRYATVRRAKG